MRLADYLLQQLAIWGVTRIYGVIGDAIFTLADALVRQPAIQFIACRHEAAAAFMASAEAKLTGRPAVCVATSGPGITNLLTGLGDAATDRSQVLAITGQSPTAQLGTDYKQDIDQQLLLAAIADHSSLLAAPAALPGQLKLAWRAAAAGGVGHLSIPKDLFAAPLTDATLSDPEPWLALRTPADPAAVAEALAQMNQAKRPVILAGHGTLPAASDLIALAEAWHAPVITALPARGLLPWSHPLMLGGLGQGGTDAATEALRHADVIVAAATNWWPQAYVPEPPQAAVIRLDAVPANIGRRGPVTVAVPGDMRHVLPRLREGLQPAVDPGWQRQLAAWKEAATAAVAAEADTGGTASNTAASTGLPPAYTVRTLARVLPPDAIVALDTGDHTVWFNRAFTGTCSHVLVSGTWRSLGFGVPAALAAKLVAPERPVVTIVGDGALSSLLGELLTMAQLAVPVTVIVMRNDMYAMEYHGMVGQGLSPLGAGLNNPDFAAVAAACGIAGRRVEQAAELEPALRQAFTATGPTVLDVATAALPLSGPKS